MIHLKKAFVIDALSSILFTASHSSKKQLLRGGGTQHRGREDTVKNAI